jgi:hypothetical protein
MPRFYEETEFDIDPCDFLDDCSSGEIEEIIEYLEENGHLKNHSSIDKGKGMGILEEEFQKKIQKISESRHILTLEEEEVIKKISDRL